jgi:hypothetical protein
MLHTSNHTRLSPPLASCVFRVVPRRMRIYTRYAYIRINTRYIRMRSEKVADIRVVGKAYIRPSFVLESVQIRFLQRFWPCFARIEHI